LNETSACGSDVKTRKRRNVVGIDMIRNNRIVAYFVEYIVEKFEKFLII
jgi:hypothetical protein